MTSPQTNNYDDLPRGPHRNRDDQSQRPPMGGYHGLPKKPAFVLPPGCELLPCPGLDRRLRSKAAEREGMGMQVMTDEQGRPVVRDVAGLRPGEVCYVLR